MNTYIARALVLSGLVLALSTTAQAQITGNVSSDVEGLFGAQSDFFQQAETTIPPWPASGLGFYPTTGPVNVPPLYPTFPNPVLPVNANIPFVPAGHLSPTFTDGQTVANYSIYGGYLGAGTNTSDAFVVLGVPGAVGMYLNQPQTTTGYAYEQANFAAAYSVGAGGLAAGLPSPRPMIVTGSVINGGYAQFGAQVNYWFLTTIPGTTIVNSTTFLGSLDYNYQISSVTGPFSQLVNFTSGGLLGATGNGFLEITGNAFVAGDPFNITVTQVPEPSTVVLAAFGLIGLGVQAVRQRRRRAQRVMG